jgi:hypothetical protein
LQKHIQIPQVNPIEVIKLKMAGRGIKPKDIVSFLLRFAEDGLKDF